MKFAFLGENPRRHESWTMTFPEFFGSCQPSLIITTSPMTVISIPLINSDKPQTRAKWRRVSFGTSSDFDREGVDFSCHRLLSQTWTTRRQKLHTAKAERRIAPLVSKRLTPENHPHRICVPARLFQYQRRLVPRSPIVLSVPKLLHN